MKNYRDFMNLLVGPFMRLDKPDKKVTGNSFFN